MEVYMILTNFKDHSSFPMFSGFFDGSFPQGFPINIPATNVSENIDEYLLEVALPGYRKDDLDVGIKQNVLTISSQKKHQDERRNDAQTTWEFACKSFERSFKLPIEVNQQSIKASYDNGILKVHLPKIKHLNQKQVKKITID